MSRLNTVMRLVTATEYTYTVKSLPVIRPCTVAGLNGHNELELIVITASTFGMRTIHYTIPKEKVVQIVAGFSEIA